MFSSSHSHEDHWRDVHFFAWFMSVADAFAFSLLKALAHKCLVLG